MRRPAAEPSARRRCWHGRHQLEHVPCKGVAPAAAGQRRCPALGAGQGRQGAGAFGRKRPAGHPAIRRELRARPTWSGWLFAVRRHAGGQARSSPRPAARRTPADSRAPKVRVRHCHAARRYRQVEIPSRSCPARSSGEVCRRAWMPLAQVTGHRETRQHAGLGIAKFDAQAVGSAWSQSPASVCATGECR